MKWAIVPLAALAYWALKPRTAQAAPMPVFSWSDTLQPWPGFFDMSQEAELVKKWEGFSAYAYYDVAGYKTIGYGHLIREGETFSEPMSEGQAMLLLEQDLDDARRAVDMLIEVDLNDNQRAALVSLVYNIGYGNFERSTMRRLLNDGDYLGAANEFGRWVKAGGQTITGLINRRTDEMDVFLA